MVDFDVISLFAFTKATQTQHLAVASVKQAKLSWSCDLEADSSLMQMHVAAVVAS